MIRGIKCLPYDTNVSFERCIACAKCLPGPIIRSLIPKFKSHTNANKYSVTTLTGCLRKAYFEYNEDKYETLQSLYISKRGKGFEWLLDSYKYLGLEASIPIKYDETTLYVLGQIDGYDETSEILLELKSTPNLEKIKQPKLKDRLQIQCYGTIFSNVFPIKGLKIMYANMISWKDFDVQLIDMTSWIKSRVIILHRSLKQRKAPAEEESPICMYCPFNSKCNLQFTKRIMINEKGARP